MQNFFVHNLYIYIYNLYIDWHVTMTDQFFIDSVGYKARHFYLLIQECLVALWFSPIARLGRKREINGYMMIQLYDSAMYGQAFICTKYSVQSIYSLRIYAEMSYKLTDTNYCLIHIHTGLGSTSWLVACWWFRIVHHIIAPSLGWWWRWIAGGKGLYQDERVMGMTMAKLV